MSSASSTPPTTDRLARQSTFEWPHAFARFNASAEEFLTRFSANHIHAVPGDITAELQAVCGYLDIDVDIIGTHLNTLYISKVCIWPVSQMQTFDIN